MTNDVEQGKGGRVASVVSGLTSLLWSSPGAKSREALNAGVEPVESESPLNVLNQEALKNGPKNLTAHLNPKMEKTGLAQKRPQTRSTVANTAKETLKQDERNRSGTNEEAKIDAPGPTRTSPRGKKRSREAKNDQVEAPKSPKKARTMNLGSRSSIVTNQSSTRANTDSRNDGGQDRPGELDKKSQHPRVEVPEQSNSQLPRPSKKHKAVKSTRKPRGEEAYDYRSDSSPDQYHAMPPVPSASQKGRSKIGENASKAVSSKVQAAAKSSATQEGDLDKVTTGKKEDPSRHVERAIDQKPPPEGTSQQIERNPDKSPNGHADSSRKVQLSQESASESSATSNVDEVNEDSSEDSEVEADDLSQAPDFAFLGAHDAWSEIVEAARDNRIHEDVDSDNGNATNLATHSTKTIRHLSKIIQQACRQYKILIKGKGKSGVEAEQEINDKLSATINEIESQIKDIREFDVQDGVRVARIKGKRIIRDIYRRGVPDMVDLLNTAIICRSILSPEGYDFKGIQELVFLMDITLDLCRRAVKWKAKPLSSTKPFVQNIKSIVFPALRNYVSTSFHAESKRLFVVERKRRNREKTQAQQQQISEQEQIEAQKLNAERRAEASRRLKEHIEQNLEGFRARRFGLLSHSSISTPVDDVENARLASSSPVSTIDYVPVSDPLWTEAQERELLEQLLQKNSRNLPATERYLKIWTAAPRLNKFPEQIQRKALELKPFLLESLPDKDYVHSII